MHAQVLERYSMTSNHSGPGVQLPNGKELDRLDIAILSALNSDPRVPASELGEIIHLSRTAVSRRLAILKDSGVFDTSPNIVSYEALGIGVRAFVELRPRTNQSVDHIKTSLLERPEILEISIVASKTLFVLDAISFNMGHLDELMKWMQRFGETETKIVFSKTKSEMPLAQRLEELNR